VSLLSLIEEARSRHLAAPDVAPERPKVRLDESGQGTAELVAPVDAGPGDFDALLAELLPEVPVSVLDVTEVRAWGNREDARKYVRCRIARRPDGGETGRELLARIPRRRGRKRPAAVTGGVSLLVPVADPQVGKAYEWGGGTAETIERFRSVTDQLHGKVRALRRAGSPVEEIVVVNMGDTTEGCMGHYSHQPFTIDCNESDQMAVATDLYDDLIDTCAELAPQVRCTVVNSNHDQPRSSSGKNLTDPGDSRAFTIWRDLARAYGKAPERYGHVAFEVPSDPLVATLTVQGLGVAAVHGHQATKGQTPILKLWNWWDGQCAGRLPAGDCDILLGGHYHHFATMRQQGRLAALCPTLDGGSQWLTDKDGVWSEPGLLTVVVGSGGVGALEVLEP